MPFAPFYEKFPDIAGPETRVVSPLNDPDLPRGHYSLIEFYCNEPGCDCRRVFLNVLRQETGTVEAVVAYGWEKRNFYVKWMRSDNPIVIDSMIGPALNLGSPITALSDALLRTVKIALKNSVYVERLKRHYTMFREVIEREARRTPATSTVKAGRNEPCPCGSGKKFKRCCGR